MKLRLLLAAAAFAGMAASANADPMTNADIISLAQANMSDDVMVAAIKGAEGLNFDTSADALVALKTSGVSDKVIQTMLLAGMPSATTEASAGTNVAAGFNPETVVANTPEGAMTLRYLTPTVRTKSRGFGFGGVAQYAVLSGSNSKTRLPGNTSFTIAIPENAQEQNYMSLAHFAVRDNGTREVLIGGGGFNSYSTGIHPDRIMATTVEPAADQSDAPSGFRLYSVAPAAPLSPGEYAVVLKAGQAAAFGVFGGATTDTFFDFGVD